MSFMSYGIDIYYDKNAEKDVKVPQITQIATLATMEGIFIFELSPVETSE